MNIRFTTRTFKEGRNFVAHAIDLDVSSCGGTKEKALESLKEAVTLFLEEAEKMGTLSQILGESGYRRSGRQVRSRECFCVQRVSLPDSLTHVES
jgi:predicted RNase H-like HicB family nuclease